VSVTRGVGEGASEGVGMGLTSVLWEGGGDDSLPGVGAGVLSQARISRKQKTPAKRPAKRAEREPPRLTKVAPRETPGAPIQSAGRKSETEDGAQPNQACRNRQPHGFHGRGSSGHRNERLMQRRKVGCPQ